MSLHIVVLAAGQGKRMHSDTPKVLHPLGGKPMLMRVIETAKRLCPEGIHVVIGHGGANIKEALPTLSVNWVEQPEQLGTGHAVMQALPFIPKDSYVLVLYADVPLLETDTLKTLVALCKVPDGQRPPLGLLLASLPDPTGLGRVVRNQNEQICAIVEEKDATDTQRTIKEIYSGICCARANALGTWLPKLNCANAQGEYYLTEIIAMAAAEHCPIVSLQAPCLTQIQGVNDCAQLQQLERTWQAQVANRLMLAGVTLADASRIDIRGELHCGRDVFIDVNNVFEGNVTLGEGSHIAPNCVIKNATIGARSEILANSVLEDCVIGNNCHVGPFARLRPGTKLGDGCKIGNFVETKNAVFDKGSKASHLSYLGDVTLGKHVNIGAGTITCNYDGVHKHKTIIEDGVFIGSDTQLIAPITVGKDATIGAGSTIFNDVPAGELTLTEAKQKTVYGWARPNKNTKD